MCYFFVLFSVSWNECIKLKSIDHARILVEREVLPSKSEVNEACDVFGRSSAVFSDMCDVISKHIKKQSQGVTCVWPAYVLDSGLLSVVFVIDMKKETGKFEFKDYDCKMCIENQCNDEGRLVASAMLTPEEIDRQSFAAILKEMRVCINKNADDLFDRHSNLGVILPSLKKSTGYLSGKHEIKKLPCIALYVKLKGYIPLKEEPFEKEIGGFQIDVLEGNFTPFTGRANDFHQNLKMGLAINGNNLGIGGGTLGGFVEHWFHGFCALTSAHVVYSDNEMRTIQQQKLSIQKEVYQPIGEGSAAFGKAVQCVYDEGGDSRPGVEAVLIQVQSRRPIDGSFPIAFNCTQAGNMLANSNQGDSYKFESGRNVDCFRNFEEK